MCVGRTLLVALGFNLFVFASSNAEVLNTPVVIEPNPYGASETIPKGSPAFKIVLDETLPEDSDKVTRVSIVIYADAAYAIEASVNDRFNNHVHIRKVSDNNGVIHKKAVDVKGKYLWVGVHQDQKPPMKLSGRQSLKRDREGTDKQRQRAILLANDGIETPRPGDNYDAKFVFTW